MLRASASFCLLVLTACSSSSADSSPGAGGTDGSSGGSGGGSSGSAGAAGAAAGPRASDELCGLRPGGRLNGEHVLRFESAEPPSVVQIERAYDGVGSGESFLYRLDSFGLVLAGETICVSEPSRLEYVNTHHNWTDIARAHADGARYELGIMFGMDDTISAFGVDGSILLPATAVIVTGMPVFCSGCPALMPVAISEVMTRNAGTLRDEAGELEAWIELYNFSSEAVDLSGWTLSDDLRQRRKWALPAVTIGQHETLVLFADGEPEQGELHTSFVLSRDGGELVVTAPDGMTDGGLVFEARAEGESLTWRWDLGSYVVTTAPTPGIPPTE